MVRRTLWALVIALSAGCTSVPLNKNYKGPEPLPLEFQVLTAPAPPETTSLILEQENDDYFLYNLIINSSRSSLYIPKKTNHKKSPVIIITPGMGGGEVVTNILVQGCVDNGLAAIVLDQPSFLHPENDGVELELILEQATKNSRSIIDWIYTQPNLDHSRIGTIGYSMGAIRNMILAAVEPRIKSHVFIMGGGNLAQMILESLETRHYVLERLRKEHLSNKGLINDLENINLDPANLAPYIDARDVLMVISRFDSIVPTKRQEEMRNLMGGPRAIYIPTGHVTGALTIYYLRRKMIEFYKQEFSQDN